MGVPNSLSPYIYHRHGGILCNGFHDYFAFRSGAYNFRLIGGGEPSAPNPALLQAPLTRESHAWEREEGNDGSDLPTAITRYFAQGPNSVQVLPSNLDMYRQ